MNKLMFNFIILFATTLAFAGDKKENETTSNEDKIEISQKFENYPFLPLPLQNQIQNQVIENTWAQLDTLESIQYLHGLESIIHPNDSLTENEVKKYAALGDAIPIYFSTLMKSKPWLKKIGHILDNAQTTDPTKRLTGQANTTAIFLNKPNQVEPLSTSIKKSNDCIICSCSFSVLGDIAIVWRIDKEHNFFVSFAPLKTVKEKNEIDLEKYAIPINVCVNSEDTIIPDKSISKNQIEQACFVMQPCLFTLDGTNLWLCYSLALKNSQNRKYVKAFESIDAPNIDQPLSAAQKAKRMGIPTFAAKELVTRKMNNMKG